MATVDFHLLVSNGGKSFVANPANNYPDPTDPKRVPTSRPASVRDNANTLSENSTKLLDYLADELGYTPLEVENVGTTLGLTESELSKLQKAEDDVQIDIDEARRCVRFAAVMTEAVIDNRACVNTPDILNASEATVREWVPFYVEKLEETWQKIDLIEQRDSTGDFSRNAAHALASAELRKRLWYFWQCCQRLGINQYSGYVTGVNLEPLEVWEAENSVTDVQSVV